MMPFNRNTPKDGKNGRNINIKRPRWPVILIYAFLFGGLIWMWSSSGGSAPVKKEWFEVRDEILPTGSVQKLVYIRNNNRGEVYVKSSSAERFKNYFPEIGRAHV